MRGITLYEPNEMVMSARAGTPLAQIEEALAARGQMLAFEPVELGPLAGGEAGAGHHRRRVRHQHRRARGASAPAPRATICSACGP